ncbi:MAG: hypothetical protein EPO06_04830 [Burkholderiaceae bacterium]|nr:MAG: hypothetical protein EPO06_04830 [Burkholderiaceae bacterium]
MLRDHLPYAVVALLFASLGANDITVFALVFMLVVLWIPMVSVLDNAKARENVLDESEAELLPYDLGTGETITRIHDDL